MTRVAKKNSVSRFKGDPFDINPKHIPAGASYQWMSEERLEALKGDGWIPVQASAHPGQFMPFGYEGAIALKGMALMSRPTAEVEVEHDKRIAKAHKNVTDWQEKYGGQFSGGFRTWTGNEAPPAPTMAGNPDVAKAVLVKSRMAPDLPKISGRPSAPSIAPTVAARPSLWRRILSLFKKDA